MERINDWRASMMVKSSRNSNIEPDSARVGTEAIGNQIMRRKSLPGLLISMALVTLGMGCGRTNGPPLGTVTGTVTLNGEPVPGVNVIFIPENKGSPSYGGTDEDGVYRLMFNRNRAGAELGKHNVLIESPQPETDDSGNPITSTVTVPIPQKYQQQGVLSAEVDPGRNEFDFELDTKDVR
jgi:hypothetical protein